MPLLNYTGKNILTINAVGTAPVQLIPGVNEISQESLEAIKAHPGFMSFVDSQQVIIMLEKLSPDGKRSVQEMLDIIPKTFDSKLLKKIISTDGRDAVTQAARDQLELISSSKKELPEVKGEHFK